MEPETEEFKKYFELKAHGISPVEIFREMMRDWLKRSQGLKFISQAYSRGFDYAKSILAEAYGDTLDTDQEKLADALDQVRKSLDYSDTGEPPLDEA
jgi:hypothetical protein